VKIAPLLDAMRGYEDIESILIHTGQHYDYKMSNVFFSELDLPEPDIYLSVGSGSHTYQIASIMLAFEKELQRLKPDLVIVVGDVNSTLACAMAAAKMKIPVAHVEAGLRSNDRDMPEEINRILTDAVSDYLFVSEESGIDNLLKEGYSKDKIFHVGNVMIDTLIRNKAKLSMSDILARLKLESENYAVLTLHRPSNVDSRDVFEEILQAINIIQDHIKIVWPIHPRARKMIDNYGLSNRYEFLRNTGTSSSGTGVVLIESLGYTDFMKLLSGAEYVMSDSGGIQEETTFLGIPCLTLRNNTERPVTTKIGTNIIAGTTKERIINESMEIISGNKKKGEIPSFWDGKTSRRIAEIINPGVNL
jgi:UDP-N-acetylglucosamine 2-epimerase (non-hydrolysing)